MKTTIKITTTRAIVVQPCKTSGRILLTVQDRNGEAASIEALTLTNDQAGALVFALEEGSAELLKDRG
jgi:hypothetical protein